MKLTTFLAAAFICIALAAIVNAAVSNFIQIHNVGNVNVFGVECDTSQIDWGTLYRGDTVNYTIQLKASEASTLSFYVTGWSPASAADFLSLNWSYMGETLEANVWTSVTFTLSVSQDVIDVKAFSFDVTIIGTTI